MCVPSSDPVQRFEDVLSNIARIEQHTAGINDVTGFEHNELVRDAVERCLERISEAAKKLGPDAETLCPAAPWPQIRGLGNVLRHEYDRVERSRIWYTVQNDLPRLKAAVHQALEALRDQAG